jgi:hypothetical protein
MRETSRDDLAKIVRDAVNDAFRDVGLHAEQPEHLEEVRADFRFVRRLRKGLESTASKAIGAIVVTLATGALSALVIGARVMLPR